MESCLLSDEVSDEAGDKREEAAVSEEGSREENGPGKMVPETWSGKNN